MSDNDLPSSQPMGARARRIAIAAAAAIGVLVIDQVVARVESPGEILLFAGRFHVLAVHAPIGVLLLAVTFEIGSLRRSWRRFVDPITGPTLELLVASAVGAFLLGSLLAREGGHVDELLRWHRRLTLTAVIACAVSLAVWTHHGRGAPWRWLYRAVLGAAVLALSAGAHFGGSMTHGESFLTRHAPWRDEPPAPPPPPIEAEPTMFVQHVQPIFHTYCTGCHGADRAKGGLRLDTSEGLFGAGESGPALVAGDVRASPLLVRMQLPEDHPDRMPPEGEPAPTADEIALIRWWIARGAKTDVTVSEAIPPQAVLALVARGPTGTPSATTSREPSDASQPEASQPEAPEPEPVEPAAPASEPQPSGATAVVGGGPAVLATYCGGCHGAKRARGGLRTDSVAALIEGGQSGPAIVAGSPRESALVERLRLPLSHADHMPPDDEPQPTEAEIATIARFIASLGARAARRTDAAQPSAHDEETTIAAESEIDEASEGGGPPEEEGPLVVGEVLRRRCAGCHGGKRPAGGLSLEDDEVPDASELLRRIQLPLTARGHMPPRRSPQLSGPELELLVGWASPVEPPAPAQEPAQAAKAPPRGPDESGASMPPPAAPRGGCAACSLDPSPRGQGQAWLLAIAAAAFGVRRRRARPDAPAQRNDQRNPR